MGNLAKFYRLKEAKIKFIKDNDNKKFLEDETYYISENCIIFNEVSESKEIRNIIDRSYNDSLIQKFPEIKLLNYISYPGVCYSYAFCKIAKTYLSSCFPPILEGNIEVISQNFTSVDTPKKGDLVLYYSESKISPVHYGIYRSQNIIRSKWRKGNIYEHPIFYIPNAYGNYVKFYHLNGDLNPKTFVEKIEKEWNSRHSNNIKGYFTLFNKNVSRETF
jgi:hypothetical protein